MTSFAGEKLKPLLIGAIGLLVAIVFGFFIGSSDYRPLLLAGVALVGMAIWFGTGQWFWLLAIASSYLGGTFPILGGSFTPFQILMAIGVGKFFVEEVIMRRKSFAPVERKLLLWIIGFMGIITLHGVQQRFGMRFLGSSVWGGRNYVNIYVGLVAFFVIQSVSVRTKFWNKLPYLVLAVCAFDLLIAIVTTIFPASIYRIYPFYSAVGTAGITELMTGHEEITGRIGSFGNFGCVLVAMILAATPVYRLVGLQHLGRLAAVAIGCLAVLYSGFRSAVANLFFTCMAAGFRDFRWRILAALPLLAAALFALAAVNSSVITLPKQMQRSLTFVPGGDWDYDMARDANSSNDFRAQVWTLWLHEYFPQQPLLGRGFGFRSEWTQRSVYNPRAVDYQQMVETGNIHNGLFASLDAIGIVGTIFFVGWNIQLLWQTFRVSFDKNPAGFALRFLALQLAVSILCYWFGAITLGTFLPQQFALAGVFLRLHRSAASKAAEPTVESFREDGRPQLVRA